MARKIVKKLKQKQKQKQKQTVIVNITQPTRRASSKNAPPQKPFIPLMPSFNINQPVPAPLPDLAKSIGLLSPALQTQSKLGTAINTAVQPPLNPVEPLTRAIGTQTIGSLMNPLYAPTMGQAVQYATKEPVAEKPPKPLDFPSIYEETPKMSVTERYLKSIRKEPEIKKEPEPVLEAEEESVYTEVTEKPVKARKPRKPLTTPQKARKNERETKYRAVKSAARKMEREAMAAEDVNRAI